MGEFWDFVVRVVRCWLLIGDRDAVLGDSFLKNVVAVFDVGGKFWNLRKDRLHAGTYWFDTENEMRFAAREVY